MSMVAEAVSMDDVIETCRAGVVPAKPLIAAAQSSFLALMRCLIESGVLRQRQPKERTTAGFRCLLLLSEKRHLDVLQCLLNELGA
jgi:hypothetical protein